MVRKKRTPKEQLEIEMENLPLFVRDKHVKACQISFHLEDDNGNNYYHHICPSKVISTSLAQDVIKVNTGKKKCEHHETYLNFIEDKDVKI
jgi:hypothetical protein